MRNPNTPPGHPARGIFRLKGRGERAKEHTDTSIPKRITFLRNFAVSVVAISQALRRMPRSPTLQLRRGTKLD
jgi:hypothetical protein